MAETKIEWATQTWNPTTGCSRVSTGCDHCYAMHMARRFDGQHKGYDGTTRRGKNGTDWTGVVLEHTARLGDPFKWRKPERVFVDLSVIKSANGLREPDAFLSNIFGEQNTRRKAGINGKQQNQRGLLSFRLQIGQHPFTKHLRSFTRQLGFPLNFKFRLTPASHTPPHSCVVILDGRPTFQQPCYPINRGLMGCSPNDLWIVASALVGMGTANTSVSISEACKVSHSGLIQQLNGVYRLLRLSFAFFGEVAFAVIIAFLLCFQVGHLTFYHEKVLS